MARGTGPRRDDRRLIPLASILILACIVAAFWVTFDRVGSVLAARQQVARTWRVKTDLERTYGIVAAAESDLRAWFISKDEPSFARYRAAGATTAAAMRDLRGLAEDNADQRANIDRLQGAVDERFAAMRRTVEVRSRLGLEESVVALRSGTNRGRGLRAMQAVREAVRACSDEEDRLLALRLTKSETEAVQAELAFGVSILISVVLITAFGLLSHRLVRAREAAAEDERSHRNLLEQEIERTRAAEARLEATLVELRRSNEELQNFAFVASHDLQEPLRKIRAFSDRVRRRAKDTLDEESKDSLQRVEAAAERMQRLILDLLELSRITTKSRPHAAVDLGAIVEEVADDLQTRLEETGGTVRHGRLDAVTADPAQIRQLFQNLIANALKFRREGVPPEVTIETQARLDGRVSVFVRDNGIGFEEKYADRIFVVFQRLHGRGEYEGSGIGLAIVRKIVERHGGTIEAQGRPGEGAAFAFDLPGTVPTSSIVDSDPSG